MVIKVKKVLTNIVNVVDMINKFNIVNMINKFNMTNVSKQINMTTWWSKVQHGQHDLQAEKDQERQ